jgi:hypothetical protein
MPSPCYFPLLLRFDLARLLIVAVRKVSIERLPLAGRPASHGSGHRFAFRQLKPRCQGNACNAATIYLSNGYASA